MSSYSRIAKVGVIWGFVGRGFNEFISIPTSFVLARILTPYDFGVGAAAGFFVQIAQRAINFGFNTALVQAPTLKESHTATVFVINVILGVLTAGVLVGASGWLGQMFDSDDAAKVIRVAALSFAIGSLGAVSQSLLVRHLRFRAAASLDAIYVVVMSGGALFMAWKGYGYWSLIWPQVVATAVQTVGRVVVAGWRPTVAFSSEALRELLSFGLGLHFKRLLDSVAQNVDNLVIGRTLGLTALGFYDKAFMTMTRALTAVNSAGPSVSFRIFALIQDDQERFRRAYRKVLLTATFVAYPSFAWLIALAPDLFLVLFGPQWASAVWPFRILCVAAMLRVLNTYASTATQARGWVWGEVWRQLAYIALIVAGTVVGSLWGLTGGAIGVVVATAVMTLTMHALLRRASAVSLGDLLLPQLPATLCAIGVLVLMTALRTLTPWLMGGELRAVAVLASSGILTLLWCLAFLIYGPSRELREVTAETITEFVPSMSWLTRLVSREAPEKVT